EGRVCAGLGRKLELSNLRIHEIFIGWRGRAGEKLRAVDDLHHAVLVGAIAEIDAVVRGPSRNRTVKLLRGRPRRIRLLSGQAKVTDEYRLGRIAQVVDLRHAPRAPRRQS